MDENLRAYMRLVEKRSCEHNQAFGLLYAQGLYGACAAIIRLEIDNLMRVDYLAFSVPLLTVMDCAVMFLRAHGGSDFLPRGSSRTSAMSNFTPTPMTITRGYPWLTASVRSSSTSRTFGLTAYLSHWRRCPRMSDRKSSPTSAATTASRGMICIWMIFSSSFHRFSKKSAATSNATSSRKTGCFYILYLCKGQLVFSCKRRRTAALVWERSYPARGSNGRYGPTSSVRTPRCSLLIMCFVANHDKASNNP